jgi:hypothetical protein
MLLRLNPGHMCDSKECLSGVHVLLTSGTVNYVHRKLCCNIEGTAVWDISVTVHCTALLVVLHCHTSHSGAAYQGWWLFCDVSSSFVLSRGTTKGDDWRSTHTAVVNTSVRAR